MTALGRVGRTLKSGLHDLTHRPRSQEPALDALRAAAVLLVICTHYALPEWPKAHGPEIRFTHWPMFYYGWTGVDLFFVLSGLLIGTQVWREIDRTGSINVPRFLLKRGLRIWPLYFFVLTALLVTGHDVRWPDWTFLSNYVETAYPRSWSLSTEEQFYIVVPLLLLLVGRVLPKRFQVWPIVGLLWAIPVVRFIERQRLFSKGLSAEVVHNRMVGPIHLHAEALLAGLILAWIAVQRPRWIAKESSTRVSRRGLAVLIVGTGLGLALDVVNKELFAFTALGLIFGSCTYFVLVDRSSLTRPLHAFVFYPISRLSYGMYLNHFLVIPASTAWAIATVPGPLPVVFFTGLILGTLISVAAAVITFLLIEHPFLQLRGHLLHGDRSHTASAVGPNAGRALEGVPIP
jgi:peptidoglycan/LPS O-acetylase OafA/YrhL